MGWNQFNNLFNSLRWCPFVHMQKIGLQKKKKKKQIKSVSSISNAGVEEIKYM